MTVVFFCHCFNRNHKFMLAESEILYKIMHWQAKWWYFLEYFIVIWTTTYTSKILKHKIEIYMQFSFNLNLFDERRVLSKITLLFLLHWCNIDRRYADVCYHKWRKRFVRHTVEYLLFLHNFLFPYSSYRLFLGFSEFPVMSLSLKTVM